MTTKPLKKGATYDDLARVPEHYVAEMFDGELYASPRPAPRHSHAAVALTAKLAGPFHFDRTPGGWLLLIEPELHFRNDVAPSNKPESMIGAIQSQGIASQKGSISGNPRLTIAGRHR